MIDLIQIGILVSVLLVLLVGVYAIMTRIRRPGTNQLPRKTQAMIPDAKVEPYERPSSLVSEQIEEIAKRKLSAHPDLVDTALDFGAMPDGTIDIWVNSRQYDDIADIPDERIRKAIQEAVGEFNA